MENESLVMKWFQKVEFIFISLLAFSIPVSWYLATYMTLGLFVVSILKVVFYNGLKINPIKSEYKIVYILFIAFWFVYAASYLYSDNLNEAKIQIYKKLPFLIIPSFFLFTDLTYLNKKRVRKVLYFFILGILSVYLINLIWSIYDIIFNGKSIDVITQYDKFFKTKKLLDEMHRGYFSIMTCMALVFCFIETFNCKKIGCKIFNLLSLLLFTLSPFYVTSRAGILCTLMCLVLLWIWLIVFQKKKKAGVVTGIVIVSILTVGYEAFPKSIDRFKNTITKLKEGKGDVRLTAKRACRNVIKDNILFGVGAGDRNDETINGYIEYKESIISNIEPLSGCSAEEFDANKRTFLDEIHKKYGNETNDNVFNYAREHAAEYCCDEISTIDNIAEYQLINHAIDSDMNAHNQLYDTMISVGLFGTLILIALLIMPIYLCIKEKKMNIAFILLLVIITFNSLFESVFERQMGIVFFIFIYFMIFHGTFISQADNNQQVYHS